MEIWEGSKVVVNWPRIAMHGVNRPTVRSIGGGCMIMQRCSFSIPTCNVGGDGGYQISKTV